MLKGLGIRAHDFGKQTSENLAALVKKNGLCSIQLALNKAKKEIERIERKDLKIDKETIENVHKAFDKENVDIAVLGCYLNYAHPEASEIRKNIDIFKHHIEYAKILKARTVGTETGSVKADYSFDPKNHSEEAYETFRNSLVEMLAFAEEKNVVVAIEGVSSHIIHTNQKMKRLLDEINSKYLKVILDPVNLLNSQNYNNQEDVLKESFDLLSDDIIIVHAKDFIFEDNKIIEVSHGTGLYRYETLLEQIRQSKNEIDVLLENANISELQRIKALFT